MWRWRVVIGLASAGQVAAGLAYLALSADRRMAPFGLALCAGVGILSLASQVAPGLARVAVGANAVLAVLTGLGGVAPGIAILAGVAPPWLAGYAIGNTALAAASAGSAVGLRRLSPRSAGHAEPGAAAGGGRGPAYSESADPERGRCR